MRTIDVTDVPQDGCGEIIGVVSKKSRAVGNYSRVARIERPIADGTDQMGDAERRPAIDWAEVLARHDRWLRCVVQARLGDRQGVDEVMQETALAAVRQQAPIHDVTKIAPWLYRLAVTQSLLYRRRLGRKRKLVERYAGRVRPSETAADADPLEWLMDGERRRLVRVALKRLPPRDAEILLLKYAEDWNYGRIAEHLGISHSAVETRLHRARTRLRAALTELEPVEP